MDCISSVRGTVLTALGMEVPENIPVNAELAEYVSEKTGENGIDRVVIYNPDAVAWWLYEKYESVFAPAKSVSEKQFRLRSVMPSVTPVCFASMYSGVMPEVHGIKKYEKPVLRVETLFDDFVKAGKKAAIVSTAGDSISKIFLERDIDYFIYPSVHTVNRKALSLLRRSDYSLIVIYNGNYDSTMHKNGPEAKKSLGALRRNVEFYNKIVRTINVHMKHENVLYGFCPDHGCHEIDGGSGSHGLDMDEDMYVTHFYGVHERFYER